jgi:hypothetical protein
MARKQSIKDHVETVLNWKGRFTTTVLVSPKMRNSKSRLNTLERKPTEPSLQLLSPAVSQ